LRAPPKNYSKKEKSILLGSALNEQAAGAATIFARARRNSPHTPLPPRPRFGGGIFKNTKI